MAGFGAKIPGWLDKIQFISFWTMNPCEVPFMAYVESARPITNEILLVFLTIDARQLLRAVFRPKWMRSHRHTRRGPRKGRRLPGVPEPADLLADILDPDHHLRPRRWFLGFRMLLEWIDITDRIFWTIFLVEMLDTLIINTLVGILEADQSICPNIGRMLRSADLVTIGGAGPVLRPVNLPEIEYVVGMTTVTGFQARVEEGLFVLVFAGAITCTLEEGQAQPVLFVSDADGARDVEGDLLNLTEGEYKQFVISERVRGPAQLFWRMNAWDGFYRIAYGRAFVIQIGE